MNLEWRLLNFEGIHLECYQNLGLEGYLDASDWEINLMKEAFRIGFEMANPLKYDEGFADGQDAGYDAGSRDGYNEGYEEAKWDKCDCNCEECT